MADTLVIVGAVAVVGLLVVLYLRRGRSSPHINTKIAKHKPKVVNTVDIEDLSDATAFCRCWKSSKFPYCDGSHNNHNKHTGDNVGPLLVNRKS